MKQPVNVYFEFTKSCCYTVVIEGSRRIGGIILSEDILRNRIIEIYKSDEGINGKIGELKTAFPDGEIIENVEQLYEEGILVIRDGKGSGKESFLSKADNDKEVTDFYPEVLRYK